MKKVVIIAEIEINKDSEQPIKKLEDFMRRNNFKNIKINVRNGKMWGTFKDLGDALKFG